MMRSKGALAGFLVTPLLLAAGFVWAPLGAGPPAKPVCDPDNGGLTLPPGFCAVLVAESLGSPRHIAVAPNGDVFVARTGRVGGVVVLRDTSGDGKADVVATFYQGPGGSGIALASDAVYYGSNDHILRFPWKAGLLAPSGAPDTVAQGLPIGGHAAKGLALGRNGALFVSFGSEGNMCGLGSRDKKPGPDPCLELAQRAGVWRFDAKQRHQTAADAKRWATGLRNPMAVSIQPGTGTPYAGVHGRDNLTETWGFPPEEGRENPAETVFELREGANGGWPYCYFDSRKKTRMQNPEYGGDGSKVGNCERIMTVPALSFPGHWAPNATMFYNGEMFPAQYHDGLFVAFHGSWNRAPGPQEGYRVVFAPFKNRKAVGTYETFAAPSGAPTSVRPTGLAVGPDGSLYISADAQGKIWRVMYRQ